MTTNSSINLAGITGIARRLVQDGIVDELTARKALAAASETKTQISQYLLEKKIVSSAQIAAVNAVEFGVPLLDVSTFDITQNAMKLVSEDLIEKYQILPLYKRGNRLFIGITNPTHTKILDDIKFHTNLSVEPVLIDQDIIRKTLELWVSSSDQDLSQWLASSNLLGAGDGEKLDTLEALNDDDAGDEEDTGEGDDTPIVKFVNKILVEAIRKGASDIHFEPYETEYRVRMRIDGMLKTIVKTPAKHSNRIAARLKVMAQLDIAEKRNPQDGRIKLNLTKTKQLDFRVSTLPTLFGEKVVLRVLDGSAAKLGIDRLGYEPSQQELFVEAIQKPYGMVLVTGPTGSGKTVSLYTALNILNDETRNISTVEDPVEIRVPGINQVQMNVKRGMTFAAALRSFLRQDPDVIMVGEIRDLETAEIAIKAAQTGHMVLSTLHTNDGPQTIARLMNMGIAPYNIISSVSLVVAQRLARRLCNYCKKPMDLPEKALIAEGFTEEDIVEGVTVYEPIGCDDCTEGYKGRVGIYQVMPLSEEIQAIILEGGNAMDIAQAAQRSKIKDLRQSALLKARQGHTSLAEVNRVTKD